MHSLLMLKRCLSADIIMFFAYFGLSDRFWFNIQAVINLDIETEPTDLVKYS